MTYDLVRSGSPVDFESAGTTVCIAQGVAASTAEDEQTPDPGEVFFYLSRARNHCGPGSVGTNSSGAERTARDCP